MKQATHTFPWIHLTGGNGTSYLWAGGYVTEKALEAHLVRLTARNGVVLEDTVENGLVLFQTDQPIEVPVQLEVFTHSSELIGRQAFLNDPDLS